MVLSCTDAQLDRVEAESQTIDYDGCNTTKHKLGVQKKKLMEVKEELVKLGTTQWHNLNKCGPEHQYLPGLCTNTKMSQLKRNGGRVD